MTLWTNCIYGMSHRAVLNGAMKATIGYALNFLYLLFFLVQIFTRRGRIVAAHKCHSCMAPMIMRSFAICQRFLIRKLIES